MLVGTVYSGTVQVHRSPSLIRYKKQYFSCTRLNDERSSEIDLIHSSFSQFIKSWQKWQYWHQRIYSNNNKMLPLVGLDLIQEI